MSTVIPAQITTVGQAAALAQNGLGLSLGISHVTLGAGAYTPSAAATAMVDQREVATVLYGFRSGSQVTLYVDFGSFSGVQYGVGEIGFWAGNPGAGGVLFAVISAPGRSSPLRGAGINTTYSQTFVLSLASVPAASVSVIYDPGAGAPLAALGAHVAAVNPHPQYVRKAGDTMAGPLALPGAATLAPQAVPLSQVQSLIAAALGGGVDAQTINIGAKLFKFGTSAVIPVDSVGAVTFTTPFPVACDVVVMTAATDVGILVNGASYSFGHFGKTVAGFSINNDSQASAFDWVAIGR